MKSPKISPKSKKRRQPALAMGWIFGSASVVETFLTTEAVVVANIPQENAGGGMSDMAKM